MDELIASAKKEVLVEMVKLAQKRGMAGSKGHWKEFLKVYDKKFGASLSDPSRRSVDSLAAFLKTFTQDDDLKFFKKVIKCHRNREDVEQFKKISPDNETAEQKLVRLTLEHPQYPIDYSFPSHEEEWLVIKRTKKSKALKSTDIIAIDCEMVLCEDGTEALVKVCAVDRNFQVKLDEVVNPDKAIADYRTDITGISAKDLDGVTHSLKDVQKSLKKLLSHGTILVGHSLNNDLQALKLDHTRVIDTSYVFKYANGLTNKKPSLSFLCKLKELDIAKLLVHRIPVTVHSRDLDSILPGEFTIEVKDSCGRPQKLVKFALDSGISGTLCVCKIVPEFSVGQLTKKRSVQDDNNTAGILKKLRTDQTGQLEDSSHCTNQCDTHLQEIERLKGELTYEITAGIPQYKAHEKP
ncbi:UNVERIFIED_CONTAM: Small RNA degrading nuclease 3 [Sesamum latifolium]|uniref:Small RNA degrading nuclease 3 n=1 Tax=Sesamum latifolium TaxID=2727402 RepID=A0AAW2XE12_9LAMI